MTLFASNAHAFRAFMGKISLVGASINYKKSFIIRLDRRSLVLSLDGQKLCNIPVLKPGECKRILGIFYSSEIDHYVRVNWNNVHEKCVEVLKTWATCFSSSGFTSLMGRALVVHVMVHSKVIYLMQCMRQNLVMFTSVRPNLTTFF